MTDASEVAALTSSRPAMPALLLCGGRGTRLDGEQEKPLVSVGDRPMVGRVLEALDAARVA